ncbi:MAG: hypothetical protein R3181_14675 [Rubricoccaceae bacterium]|nr:hypothetical protein [Rubricoccaceae bacterium]
MPDLFERYAPHWLNRADRRIAAWMAEHGPTLLRYAVGLVFIWFGGLKLFEGASPAEALVKRTVYWFEPAWFFPLLGVWEVAIGVGLLVKPLVRLAILLLFLQMPGTFMPLVIVPEACWEAFPFVLTLEGQYIVKNLVIIAAALVVGGTVRAETDAPRPHPASAR